MSQISVVQYNPAAPQKILQQNTATNHSKPNDRHIIVLRKPPPPILPQPKDYCKDDILITNPGKKGFKKGGKDLKTNPQPIAVARRNARERNRVKQVNNGFANLRQHIPSFIAQAFESSNTRGSKKLSKVETLKMAVEYIRSLEDILTLDGYTMPTDDGTANLSCASPTSQNDSSQSDLQGYPFMMTPSDDEDDFSSVATTSPQQYIRINPSDNTYEIVPTTMYDNSENMDPMTINQHHQLLSDQNLLDSGLELSSQDLSYLQVNPLQTTIGSLSPGMYSEGSLSPHPDSSAKLQDSLPQNCFIPVFATGRLGENFNVHIKTEVNEMPVISLKREDGQQNLQEGIQVLNWWDQNPGHATSS